MQERLFELDYELRRNFKFIKATYNLLNMNNELKISSHSAGQWLLDNMYIVEQEYNSALLSLDNYVKVGLPMVKPTEDTEMLRIMFMANEIVTRNNGVVDDGIVSNYIREFQKQTYVTFDELSILPVMLRVAVIRYIKKIR